MFHEQFEHQNVANSIANDRFKLKNAANTLETAASFKFYKFHQNIAESMENDGFQLQNGAKTVEMAASSSKMLQIARKRAEKQIKKKTKREKQKHSQNNSRPKVKYVKSSEMSDQLPFNLKKGFRNM